jgi:2,4-dienoyl-CoA reductase-like NADH-dependent reductase (Old Yellow Enzyme family)
LFSPLKLREITLPNRIAISPMCQYSATDGVANDWHLVQLGRFAIGGAGMVMVEATAVEARGRISNGDLGLYRDDQIAPLSRIATFIRSSGSIPAIQISHAGRKASMQRAWNGNGPLGPDDFAQGETEWPIIAPSAISLGEGWKTPTELPESDMLSHIEAWVEAARRADKAGFDVLEIHAAHGYLLHSFLSPLSNRRVDSYGGSFENRTRLPLAVVRAVRAAWPQSKPLFVRISSVDGIDGGWELEDSVRFACLLREIGVDVIDCSSGGLTGSATASGVQMLPRKAGYQVPYADTVRRGSGMPTIAVGLILTAGQAEAVLADGSADIIAIGRAALDDPNWASRARCALEPDAAYQGIPRQIGWWRSRWRRLLHSLGNPQTMRSEKPVTHNNN